MEKVTIVSFLWYDPIGKRNPVYIFTPDHVDALKRMVAENLTVAHDFVCVTDRPEIFDSGIDTVPIDRTTFVPNARFAKLMLFRRDAAEILGERLLYLDLDCVVTGNLNPIVKREEDLVLWRYGRGKNPRSARYNSSMILLRAGTRAEIYETFDPATHPDMLAQKWGGTDQAWISYMSPPDNPIWDQSHGVYGAGWMEDNSGGRPTELPANARIVFFPGGGEPSMRSVQEKHPWIVKFRK